MKNKVLSIIRAVIPYFKELREMAGSMEGCILMKQLEYWFAMKPACFYKFLEPVQPRGMDEEGNPIPGHRLYRQGDSWCEELNCSPHEFRRMFDVIGVRWSSKSKYINATDPFCGRGYCSYIDRKENVTYYFRNHALVDAFLDKFVIDDTHNLNTSGIRSTDLGESDPHASQKQITLEQKLPAENTSTTTGGVWDENDGETKVFVWQEGELQGSIEEFIDSAVWMQQKTKGITNLGGFTYRVRNRINSNAPNPEDWVTLRLWRASQIKFAPEKNTEDATRDSKKLQLEAAKERYGAMTVSEKKEIESRFVVHIQANNKIVYHSYQNLGLDSYIAAGAFYEWFVGERESVFVN